MFDGNLVGAIPWLVAVSVVVGFVLEIHLQNLALRAGRRSERREAGRESTEKDTISLDMIDTH